MLTREPTRSPVFSYAASAVAELLISQPDGQVLAQRKLNSVRGYWIGSETSCDIVIEHPTVTRRHAFLFHCNGRWVICDAGSVEGLQVETGVVRSALLSSETWVSIGSLYIWLSGGAPIQPDWIDARPFPQADGKPLRLAKLAIEDLKAYPEPPAVSEVLTVTDSHGGAHLCVDLGGIGSSKGGGVPRITVGRSNSADLQLCHPSVDPIHCVLALGSERWSIVDAGSSHGIIWEGKRWYRKRLEEGLTVPVGEFRLSMQRILRSSAPTPPAEVAKPGEMGRAPRKPSAFLGGNDDAGL
jgi:pSer/pThr/pTyr-binding forkhead associated (FHA) protein